MALVPASTSIVVREILGISQEKDTRRGTTGTIGVHGGIGGSGLPRAKPAAMSLAWTSSVLYNKNIDEWGVEARAGWPSQPGMTFAA